jgi:hypothetical protein
MKLQNTLGRAWLQKKAKSVRVKTSFSNMRSLRGCGGALPPRKATTEEGGAELQDGAERLKRGLSFPAGSLRAPGPAAADAGREEE